MRILAHLVVAAKSEVAAHVISSLTAFSRQGRNRPVAMRRLKRFFDLVYPSDHSTLTTLVLSPHQVAGWIDMVNLLDVEIWGSGIIVTAWYELVGQVLQGNGFAWALCGGYWNKNDPRVTMTASEFLAKAWQLANERARELGWIT
jgi:hypothetical protein